MRAAGRASRKFESQCLLLPSVLYIGLDADSGLALVPLGGWLRGQVWLWISKSPEL